MRWSRPLICCSITCSTVLSTVSAEAPGYEELIWMEGGAMVGYCSTGSEKIDSAPATMTAIASAIAKIGRSMKKFAIWRLTRRLRVRKALVEWSACGGGGRFRRRRWLGGRGKRFRRRRRLGGRGRGLRRDRPYEHPRLYLLDASHDHPLAVGEPALDDPLVTEGARRPDHAHADLVVRIHDERGGLPLRVVRHADLGHEDRVVAHPLFDPGADEHPGQQHVLRIRKDGAHGHRARPLVDGDVGELQRPLLRVLRSVFEDERHLRLTSPVQFQPAARHVAP